MEIWSFLYYLYTIAKKLYKIKYMKLTQKAITKLKRNKRARARLQLELDKSEYTINKYIQENDDNLTKAAALKVIREETGLKDKEILEEEKPERAVA